MEQINKQSIIYKDKFLWIVGYPLAAISFIFFANDNPTLKHIQQTTFYTDLLFAICTTFAIGVYIKRITQLLDKQKSWEKELQKRSLYQLVLGIFLPLIVSMLLEIIYLQIVNIPIQSSSMLNLELPLSFIFLLIANLFYLVNYLFYHQNTDVIRIVNDDTIHAKKIVEYITVQKGFIEERVNIENCALLSSSNKIVWLYTYYNEQYRLLGTLEEWEEKLKNNNFYRINRQNLASLNAIESTELTETRKLKVNFIIPTGEVYVSKPNVALFRQWWQK
jgi:hypothetical protein